LVRAGGFRSGFYCLRRWPSGLGSKFPWSLIAPSCEADRFPEVQGIHVTSIPLRRSLLCQARPDRSRKRKKGKYTGRRRIVGPPVRRFLIGKNASLSLGPMTSYRLSTFSCRECSLVSTTHTLSEWGCNRACIGGPSTPRWCCRCGGGHGP
jgi:hypothetical protein